MYHNLVITLPLLDIYMVSNFFCYYIYIYINLILQEILSCILISFLHWSCPNYFKRLNKKFPHEMSNWSRSLERNKTHKLTGASWECSPTSWRPLLPAGASVLSPLVRLCLSSQVRFTEVVCFVYPFIWLGFRLLCFAGTLLLCTSLDPLDVSLSWGTWTCARGSR